MSEIEILAVCFQLKQLKKQPEKKVRLERDGCGLFAFFVIYHVDKKTKVFDEHFVITIEECFKQTCIIKTVCLQLLYTKAWC